MPSITSLVARLEHDFPQFTFERDEVFSWSPGARTIYYRRNGRSANLLHEVAHAVLGHATYGHDIRLLEMERDAWQYASEVLASRYQVRITTTTVETAIDTYRDWLHARSTCPRCSSTGLQTGPRVYSCLACGETWRVNDARVCSLRRYRQKPQKNTP